MIKASLPQNLWERDGHDKVAFREEGPRIILDYKKEITDRADYKIGCLDSIKRNSSVFR